MIRYPGDRLYDGVAFAVKVQSRMDARGLSLRKAGAEMGVDQATLHRLVSGKPPHIETFLRVIRWLDAPVSA